MTGILHIALLTLGLLIGGFAVWFALKSQVANATAESRAELLPQLSVLELRLSSMEEQIREYRASSTHQVNQIAELTSQIQKESNARAAAEQQNTIIPILQSQLAARDTEIQSLHNHIITLRAGRS